MTEEFALPGANVESVVCVGDTIRRSTGPWTPAVHDLLRHLESVGFDRAPRVLGMDDQGREILTLMPGSSGFRPWPSAVRSVDSLRSSARLIRSYHDAVAGYVPPDDAVWRFGTGTTRRGEIVVHNDLAPWNTMYDADGSASSLIDWDFAYPAPALSDLAYAAWTFVPLRDDAHSLEVGFERPHDRAARLDAFLDAYGLADRAGFVDRIIERKWQEQRWVLEMGAQRIEPWARFLSEGHADHVVHDVGWLESNRAPLDDVCS